ncbi:MAG: MFS transporter [Mogibacterium sp.]|nr:MFS transporter [Mogibacterium sp.]
MISTRNKIFIVVLMASGFIGSLSQNLLTSALPSIMATFGITAAVGQWLTTSYILFMGVMTAVSAYMFYRFPTKKLVLASLGIFAAGCLIDLFAPYFGLLLVGRLIQALGAGPLIPLLQIAVMYIFPPDHQGEALGLTGIIVGFAPAIGPTLSGLLVDAFGWRSIFVFLIGFAGLLFAAGLFSLRELGERVRMPLDGRSLILYSAGFTSFMLAVTFMKSGNPVRPSILLLFALGAVTLTIFVRRQGRLETPLLKLSLLRTQSLVFGSLLLGTMYFMNMAGTILVPLFNQTICPYSPTVSGLILLPGSLLIALLSHFSGKLVDRYGAKAICLCGMALMLAGNLPFVFFTETAGAAAITLAYAVRCLGVTFLMTPSSVLAMQDLSLEDKPYGNAILHSARQMSGALLSTILVVIATIASATEHIDAGGMHVAFAVMAGASVLGILLTMRIKNR